MKPITFSFAALFTLCISGYGFTKTSPLPHNGFNLIYIEAGFGSNYYEMQPMFRVKGTKYVYSMEDAWVTPGEQPNRDTICTGSLRTASIDSIISLVETIPDTSIYRSARYLSGSLREMIITTPGKKLVITMFNSYEPTADKIVAILNSNLPPGADPLRVSTINKDKY